MMSFPWSYSILGLVPGLILTMFIAGVVLYTSLVVWYVPYFACALGHSVMWVAIQC